MESFFKSHFTWNPKISTTRSWTAMVGGWGTAACCPTHPSPCHGMSGPWKVPHTKSEHHRAVKTQPHFFQVSVKMAVLMETFPDQPSKRYPSVASLFCHCKLFGFNFHLHIICIYEPIKYVLTSFAYPVTVPPSWWQGQRKSLSDI